MKLIVGLGNPGKEYENTRHNTGFLVIDSFARKNNVEITKKKFNGLYSEVTINKEKVILLKPQTYMNLSGESVARFVNFYKIDIKDILVINDDLDLEVGRIRLRKNGQSGGHNGLKNIALNLGTNDFKRLRVGISKNKQIDTKDYVLGKFSSEEKEILDKVIEETDNILTDYIKLDFDKLMSRYNGTDFTGEKDKNEHI